MADGSWQSSLDQIRGMLASVDAGGAGIDEALRDRVKSMTQGWDANRFVYTFGQIDAEKAARLAESGAIEWWHAMSGHAYFGDVQGIRLINERRIAAGGGSLDFSSTLSWASFAHSVTAGTVCAMDAGVVRQLLEWGGSPGYEGGKYYGYALRDAGAGVIRAYLDHGASETQADKYMNELLGKKEHAQATRINDALGRGGFFAKVDATTLQETKFLPDATTFKTIFNFGARRVNEIYIDGGGKDARITMTSQDFAQVDTSVLRRAQEMLEKLGGSPPDMLDKPKLAGLRHG